MNGTSLPLLGCVFAVCMGPRCARLQTMRRK